MVNAIVKVCTHIYRNQQVSFIAKTHSAMQLPVKCLRNFQKITFSCSGLSGAY